MTIYEIESLWKRRIMVILAVPCKLAWYPLKLAVLDVVNIFRSAAIVWRKRA